MTGYHTSQSAERVYLVHCRSMGVLSEFTATQEQACTGANAGIKKKMLAVVSVPT